MTRPRHPRTARHGFTLVELMVATALVVLILTILAVAFGAASESLSRMRSMGNMATQLRTAQDRLRSDLEGPHFEPGDSPGPLRLADLKYPLLTAGGTQVLPPKGGYFRIEHGTGSKYEGQDLEGMISTRADGTCGHALDFTTKLQGRTPDELFSVPATTPGLIAQNVTDTPLAANLFVTKWARVRWQLGNQQSAGGVPVWTLYRCVRVISPTSVAGLTANEQLQVANVGGTSQTLSQLVNPTTRTLAAAITPYAAGTTYFGDDIVLTNVTSFEVKPTWTGGPRTPRGPGPVPASTMLGTIGSAIPDGTPPGANVANSDFPFDDLPVVTENTTPGLNGQRVFDTWTDAAAGWNTPGGANSIPLRIRVTALQVKIRVFDPKSLLSRQVSFVVQP